MMIDNNNNSAISFNSQNNDELAINSSIGKKNATFLMEKLQREEIPVRHELTTETPPSPHSYRSFNHSKKVHQLHHQRPSLPNKKSFTHSVSSFSLYNSHFAGERWDHHRCHHHQLQYREKQKPVSSASSLSTGVMRKEKVVAVEENEEEEDEKSTTDTFETEKTTDSTPTSSTKKAMFMFLKAFIGSGILFLPKGFQNGGLVLSILLMMMIASVCLFSFLRLVKTQQVIGGSYGDMGYRLYGSGVRYTVLFFIVISQVGFVCSYFIFISGNMVSITQVLSSCSVVLTQKASIWIPLIIVIPLMLVRHIAKFSFAVIIADLFIVFGLVCVIYFATHQLVHHGTGPHIESVNTSNFALMIATATFSFEGIGLVIPIAESMEHPEKFPFVVSLGIVIICTIYIIVGSICYLAYGDLIQAAVVYNFPPADGLTITVQLLYSIAIVLSIPLMLFPAIKIIENGVFQSCPSGSRDHRVRWLKNGFRCVLTTLCATLAYFVGGENLDKFVAFVGSFACIPLCYIIPGIFHLKIADKKIDQVFDIILILWGFTLMIYTLYVTISTLQQPSLTPLAPFCT